MGVLVPGPQWRPVEIKARETSLSGLLHQRMDVGVFRSPTGEVSFKPSTPIYAAPRHPTITLALTFSNDLRLIRLRDVEPMSAEIIAFEARSKSAPLSQIDDDRLFATACQVMDSSEWTSLVRSERSFEQLIKAMIDASP